MKTLLDGRGMKKVVMRMVHEIIERKSELRRMAIIGIRTGGVYLAERIKNHLYEIEGIASDIGTLDITLYRDDLSRLGYLPRLKKTDIQFSIDDRPILLVDDVLFSGRTARAALDAIIDFGRPSGIRLAVLIDRGGRELPIQPDFVGLRVNVKKSSIVDVHFAEMGYRSDCVVIREK